MKKLIIILALAAFAGSPLLEVQAAPGVQTMTVKHVKKHHKQHKHHHYHKKISLK